VEAVAPAIRLNRAAKTVVRWHRAGFQLHWRWRSRHREGRPPIERQLIALIRETSTA
jgi:hypothetical protein